MRGLAFIALAALICTAQVFSADDPPEDLEGIYSVVGKDVESDYTGCATIRKHGDRYILQTATTAFAEGEIKNLGSNRGVGLLHNGVLSIAWKNGDGVGVTMYEVTKDGLRGRWTALPGPKSVFHETLKKVAPLPKSQVET